MHPPNVSQNNCPILWVDGWKYTRLHSVSSCQQTFVRWHQPKTNLLKIVFPSNVPDHKNQPWLGARAILVFISYILVFDYSTEFFLNLLGLSGMPRYAHFYYENSLIASHQYKIFYEKVDGQCSWSYNFKSSIQRVEKFFWMYPSVVDMYLMIR